MTPVSLNPPGPSFNIHPNNQDCRTLFNLLDRRQALEIGELRENYHQQDDKLVLQDGSSSSNQQQYISPQTAMDEYQSINASMYKIVEEQSKNISHGSPKWTSSKMRLMKKMMRNPVGGTDKAINTTNITPITFQRSPRSNYSSGSNGTSSTTRVCSDCSTSNTPLWRSGPKGPKSLCNACGIRQRKARRAIAEAANGLATTPVNNASSSKTRLVHHKEKKSRTAHFAHFKNYKNKSSTSTTNFAISLRDNNNDFQQAFPRDEVAEAALLLMDLACGFVHF